MPTCPVWKMSATDHALCGQWRMSDKSNKHFTYRYYSCIHPFHLNAMARDWHNLSFWSLPATTRRCLTRGITLQWPPRLGLNHTYYVKGISTTEVWTPQTGSISLWSSHLRLSVLVMVCWSREFTPPSSKCWLHQTQGLADSSVNTATAHPPEQGLAPLEFWS